MDEDALPSGWTARPAKNPSVYRNMMQEKGSSDLIFAVGVLALCALTSGAAQAASYSETVYGDLSDDPAKPDALVLEAGSNIVTGGFGGGDPADFLTLTIPEAYQLSALVLGDATIIGSNSSFIGVQSGSTITSFSSAAGLLGWTHFQAMHLGTDILDNLGRGTGALGFTPPMQSGIYTFWIQELSGDSGLQYEFDFQVTPVPLPGGIWLLGPALLALVRVRRKKSDPLSLRISSKS